MTVTHSTTALYLSVIAGCVCVGGLHCMCDQHVSADQPTIIIIKLQMMMMVVSCQRPAGIGQCPAREATSPSCAAAQPRGLKGAVDSAPFSPLGPPPAAGAAT